MVEVVPEIKEPVQPGTPRIFSTVPSMRFDVFFTASAALLAWFLTTSATTANPSPPSPAASNASRLVWKAISSMVLTILDNYSVVFYAGHVAGCFKMVLNQKSAYLLMRETVRRLSGATPGDRFDSATHGMSPLAPDNAKWLMHYKPG